MVKVMVIVVLIFMLVVVMVMMLLMKQPIFLRLLSHVSSSVKQSYF